MQYAFVTLALTAATLAMPTKREALGGLDNVVNVNAITSGLPVVSGLGLGVKRGIVDNTLPGGVSGTVDSVKDTVNGVKVGVQARDLVNGLVGGGVGGTVNGLLDTVSGLNVAKRSLVGQVKDIVNNVDVDVATKRDLLNGLLGDDGLVGSLGLGETVGGVVKRDALVDGLLSGLDLDQTLGNLPVVQRDLPVVTGTVTPLLDSVTDSVDSLKLGVKRDTGSALNLGSGAVGSVLGSNSGNADKTLGLDSGLVGGLTNGLNANHVVDQVVKRDSGNALNLGSGAVGSVLGSSNGNADKTLGLDSGLVGGLTNGLNLGNTVNNVVKRDSGNALNLGSGAVGSVVGGNGEADKTLGLDSGLVGGLTNGLSLGQTVNNVVKRDSGNALNLGSGAVGHVVGNNGDADKTLGLDSGLVGGLTNGLNLGNTVNDVVKRQSGSVLGLASGTVGGVVGGQGESSSVLDLKSGTVGGLMDGLSLNHIVEGVVKRSIQELDVHSLIASLSDEQIKQLTAVLPTN